MSDVMLECRDVSIRYMVGDFKNIGLKEWVTRRLTGRYKVEEFWADRHVSFKLERCDMLGIIGTNGAGKSTILKAISGIMEPTEGCVIRNGEVSALLELASGFDGDLNVKENAYLRGAMLGYTRRFMDETYDRIVEFAELKEFEDRPFKQLSSGMKSRLAFAIASLVKPDILILDEVLSVGDGAFKAKSEAKMREIIKGGATTILVSHSLPQIRQMCNKILWLEKGNQIVFSNDVKGVCDLYAEYLNKKVALHDLDPGNGRYRGLSFSDVGLSFIVRAAMPRKRTLKVAFADVGNMGDQLNRLIFDRLLGYAVEPVPPEEAEMFGIGSHLSLLAKIDSARKPPVTVWGTGFISKLSTTARIPKTGIDYRAVRGELSRRVLEGKLGRTLDVPTGDPGLLASLLFTEPVPKRHRLGIIPHFREQDDPRFAELAKLSDDSVVIDLTGDPMEVIREIASCELIISSSLHGLIVADSFGIPNLHVKVTDKVNGDGFKFADYYSAFGIEHHPFDLNERSLTSLDLVHDKPSITREAVRAKCRQLLAAFP